MNKTLSFWQLLLVLLGLDKWFGKRKEYPWIKAMYSPKSKMLISTKQKKIIGCVIWVQYLYTRPNSDVFYPGQKMYNVPKHIVKAYNMAILPEEDLIFVREPNKE